MQLDKIPKGSFSLFEYSLPTLKIPIIFSFPFSLVLPSGNKIFESGMKIEFNISKTAGDALLIPWNKIKFFGCTSLDDITFNNSVSTFLTRTSSEVS